MYFLNADINMTLNITMTQTQTGDKDTLGKEAWKEHVASF